MPSSLSQHHTANTAASLGRDKAHSSQTALLGGSPLSPPLAKDKLLSLSLLLLERQKGEPRDHTAHPFGPVAPFASAQLWACGTLLPCGLGDTAVTNLRQAESLLLPHIADHAFSSPCSRGDCSE